MTVVPHPTLPSTMPIAESSSYAETAVFRETPKREASSREEGSLDPGGS